MNARPSDSVVAAPGTVFKGNQGDYFLEKEIGSGHFAKVYRGHIINHLPGSYGKQELLAIKVHPKVEEAKYAFVEEVKCLQLLGSSCTFIVNLREAFENQLGDQLLCVSVLEPLCRTSLEDLIESSPYSYTSYEAAEWCLQVAKALQFLQQVGVSHLDLTVRNILLSDDNQVK